MNMKRNTREKIKTVAYIIFFFALFYSYVRLGIYFSERAKYLDELEDCEESFNDIKNRKDLGDFTDFKIEKIGDRYACYYFDQHYKRWI